MAVLAIGAPVAEAANTWSPAGSLGTGRDLHSATLLPNGKVLVAGGIGASGRTATAELYDPSTDTWAAAASIGTARSSFTATLLPNGKVLVAGGNFDAGTTATALLYDYTTNTWSSAGAMSVPRTEHSATLLPNGKVLVAGGLTTGSVVTQTADLYDPATNTWSAAGALGTARFEHSATMLPNGKLLVAGGRNGSFTPTASAELYNPATNAWSAAGALGTAHYQHSATLLPNGKVLVAGGHDGSFSTTTNAELYDPTANSWSAAGSLGAARYQQTATLLGNGKVLVAGGADDNNAPLASAEVYDYVTNAWSPAGSLGTARKFHTATLLGNGKVLVAGGTPGSGVTASAELFDTPSPPVGAWASGGSMGSARAAFTATLLSNGKVLATAGQSTPFDSIRAVDLYDPATHTWSAAAPIGTARDHHTATLLPGGKLLVAGGDVAFPPALLNTAELYDPATDSWSDAASMGTERTGHTATLLPTGKVLVAGGASGSGTTASTELYNPATNAWSPAASMGTARQDFTATLLRNGKVLVAGGTNGASFLASAELYDPTANSWSPAGTLGTARDFHTATLLPNGKVLVVGGDHASGAGAREATAELYDPGTNTWSAAASMNEARDSHTATLLPNGEVLVSGGAFLASAELYDPAANSWSPAGSMGAGRTSPAATLLPNGQVLVAGGFSDASATQSADLSVPPISLSPGSLSNAAVAQPYNATLTASGGTGAHSFTVTAGALPAGLFLSPGGSLSGTPTAGGGFNFTVTATDEEGFSGSQGYSLTVNAPTITVSPTTLAHAKVDHPHSESLSADGGTAPYSLAVTAGSLPPGMTLSAGGSLSGAPTAGGSFDFTVTATDSSGGAGPYTGSRAYSLVVDPDVAPVAVDDLKSLTEDDAATMLDVLANDTDADGGPKKVNGKTDGAHGTVAITNSGADLTYTPAADFCGPDSFTYTLNGGSTGTVSVSVACVSSATTTTVRSSQPSAVEKHPVTLSATVTSPAGTPAGEVTFKDGATSIGTAPLGTDGKATLTTSDLSAGQHTITAAYAGAADFDPSSGTLTQRVRKRLKTRLTISHRTVSLAGTHVKVKLLCRGEAGARCAGTLSLDPAKGNTRRAKAATASARYGKAKFTIVAGKNKAVDVKVTAKLLSALRSKRRVISLATVRFTGLDGAKLTSKRKLTITAPHP